MKRGVSLVLLMIFVGVLLVSGCGQPRRDYLVMNDNIKRVGMVIGIRPDQIDEYKRIHADGHPGVRDLLSKYNMHNFSIYLTQIDGKWYEFGYYEYIGDDFEGDMAKLSAEPRNKEWLAVCDPMQIPLEGETSWQEMERVYFNR